MPMVEPGLVSCWSSIGDAIEWVAVLTDAIWLDGSPGEGNFGQSEIENFGMAAIGHKMFAGLMSRWTIPLACAASRASAISIASNKISDVSMGRPPIWCLSVIPSRNSMAMKACPSCFANVVNRADVGVVQCRCRLGFTLEAGKSLWVSGNTSGRNLRATKRSQAGVLRFVNHAHTATAKFFNDLIVGNGPADHE